MANVRETSVAAGSPQGIAVRRESGELNRTQLLAGFLTAGGILLGLATLVRAGFRYARLDWTGAGAGGEFFQTTLELFTGVAGWLALWGLAEVLRKLESLLVALRDSRSAAPAELTLYGTPAHAAPAATSSDLQAAVGELVNLAREMRDISLLSEAERAARLKVQGAALAKRLQQEIPALLQEHRWVEARLRVQQARERFPSMSDWDVLEQQIEQMRAGVEARDVEAAIRQVNDLAGLDAWDRATKVVQELLERHPNSAKAQELARRVALQREKGDAEKRARLMSQAQEAVNRRQWQRALSLANEMIRLFPRSAEAEALRHQLPTLAENAEIQTRQQMEADFRELMRQRRYDEALRLARELIERYPNSPQAQVLRDQLPRLEQKAVTL